MNTNLQSIKPEEIPAFDGIHIEFDVENKVLRSMTITDSEGRTLVIRHRDYSGIALLAPVPSVEVERYRLHGKIGELVVDQTFEKLRDAEAERDRVYGIGASLSIEPVKLSEPAPLEVR